VTLSPVQREGRRRRRRREELGRWSIRLALALLLLAIGIALGQALEDNPQPGETVTLERTLTIPSGGNPGSTITP
jgi:hypothetical protein